MINEIKTNHAKIKVLTAFTLMEVIVGLVIIATVFGGLTATFVGVKRYVARANRRLVAASLGRQVLNSLYQYVRADTWTPNTGPLSSAANPGVDHDCDVVGAAQPTVQVPVVVAAGTLDNFTYGNATAGSAFRNFYNVRNVTQGASEGGAMQYREVTVSISYPTD